MRQSPSLTTNAKRFGIAALMAAVTSTAMAQGNDDPIRILVGFPAGAGTDNVARIYAEELSEKLDRTVIVENKPGAGGLIAVQALKQAPAHSNSLMFAVDHQVVMLPLIMQNPGFDMATDMQSVAVMANFYTCLMVPRDSGATTFEEYVEEVTSGAIAGDFGVPAPGSQAQFVGYVVSQKHDIEMTPVPYRGAAPLITDLLGGHLPAAIMPCNMLYFGHKDKIRVLAVASDERLEIAPEAPTFGELGFVDMPTRNFHALYAANSMDEALREEIASATRELYESEGSELVKKIIDTKSEPAYGSREELETLVKVNHDYWQVQVEESGFVLQ